MKLNDIQTFSEQVKEEICFNIKNLPNLDIVIWSFLKNIADYNLNTNGIEFKTQYVCVVKLFKLFVDLNPNYDLVIAISNKKTLKSKRSNYLLSLKAPNFNDLQANLSFQITNFSNKNIASLFLVGAFLSGGSVSNPNNSSYHLEIRTISETYKNLLLTCFNTFGLIPKVLTHHNKQMLYFKKSVEISDLLKILYAQNSMYCLEDNRIERDMVNNLQRLVNLEVFNLNKVVKAAVEQSRMCQIILTSVHFNNLNDREQLYCTIRAQSPKASMQVICNLMNQKLPSDQQITKGSLSHIVEKIRIIYKKI